MLFRSEVQQDIYNDQGQQQDVEESSDPTDDHGQLIGEQDVTDDEDTRTPLTEVVRTLI